MADTKQQIKILPDILLFKILCLPLKIESKGAIALLFLNKI